MRFPSVPAADFLCLGIDPIRKHNRQEESHVWHKLSSIELGRLCQISA